MSNSAGISIVVPVYNQEQFIEKCIRSLLDLRYDNYEIILIDDGSTDSSPARMAKYADHKRVRILHQKNQGVSVARNRGIWEARQDWIMFVDPDDYVDGAILSELAHGISPETDIILSGCRSFYRDKHEEKPLLPVNTVFATAEQRRVLIMRLLGYRPAGTEGSLDLGRPWSKLYRRAFLLHNDLRFNPVLKRMQDNIFNMHCFYRANGIVTLDSCLYYYRMDHTLAFMQKYDRDSHRYIREIIRERDCLVATHFADDAEMCFYNRCATFRLFRLYLATDLCSPHHPDSVRSRRKTWRALLRSSEFSAAVARLRLHDIRNLRDRFFLLCMKAGLFFPLVQFYQCKYLVHQLLRVRNIITESENKKGNQQ